MRTSLLVIFLLAVGASCSPKTDASMSNILVIMDQIYGDLTDGLPTNDSTVTIYYESGDVKLVGNYAVSDNSKLSELKVGEWTEYYPNGKVMNIGHYMLGTFTNCCFSGPCKNYYSYKNGLWKYFNENGDLKYEVEFSPSKLHVKTSCEGGDSLIFGLIKTVPLQHSEVLTADKVFELQQVEIENSYGLTTYTPLNGELYIKSSMRKQNNRP